MKIVWTEIWVDSLEESQAFYHSLFNWRFTPFTDYDENYYIARSDSSDDPNVAMIARPERQETPAKTCVPYFKVESIEQSLELVSLPDVTITALPHATGRFT